MALGSVSSLGDYPKLIMSGSQNAAWARIGGFSNQRRTPLLQVLTRRLGGMLFSVFRYATEIFIVKPPTFTHSSW